MTVQGLDRRIEITPGICAGKPRIAGHRITVHDVAIWQQRMGISVDEIDEAFVAAHRSSKGPATFEFGLMWLSRRLARGSS